MKIRLSLNTMKYESTKKKTFIRAIIAAIVVTSSIITYAIYRDKVILDKYLSPPRADKGLNNGKSRIQAFLDKKRHKPSKKYTYEENLLLGVGCYVSAYHRKYPNALIGESKWLVEDIRNYMRNNIPNFDNEWSIYAKFHTISIQPNPPKGRRVGTIIIIEPELTNLSFLFRIRLFFSRIVKRLKMIRYR